VEVVGRVDELLVDDGAVAPGSNEVVVVADRAPVVVVPAVDGGLEVWVVVVALFGAFVGGGVVR
jgi:hypothetical protein